MDDALRLQDAVQLAGLARSGGQAKMLIQSGQVSVNGQIETRRKTRLRPGDVISVGDESFTVELGDDRGADSA